MTEPKKAEHLAKANTSQIQEELMEQTNDWQAVSFAKNKKQAAKKSFSNQQRQTHREG